ncbi:hypothetical protein AB0937_01410 [Streptomyces sp. NPDC047880]|uniref:hypothetical protein n=1 Tax=Streptomyces sp. NPDC047880 TaxID=3155626 RepID=UPI003452C690
MPTKKNKSVWLRFLLPGALIIGALLVALVHFAFHSKDEWHGDLLSSLGEALFIAGLLGYCVDGVLKTALVKDVAGLVVKTLWGTNAPQEYVEKLRDSIGSIDRMSSTVEISIELSWHDVGEILKAKCTTRSIKHNISRSSWGASAPWLGHAIDGVPSSEIEDFEVIVTEPAIENRVAVSHRERWNVEQLQPFVQVKEDGSATLREELISASSLPEIPPSGTCESRVVGTTYHRAIGDQPLILSVPALSVALKIGGPALRDLDFRARIGADELSLAPVGESLKGEHGFSHAGIAVWLEWCPMSESARAPADGGAPQAKATTGDQRS